MKIKCIYHIGFISLILFCQFITSCNKSYKNYANKRKRTFHQFNENNRNNKNYQQPHKRIKLHDEKNIIKNLFYYFDKGKGIKQNEDSPHKEFFKDQLGDGYKMSYANIKKLLTKEVEFDKSKIVLANSLIQYECGIDTLIYYDIKFFSEDEESLFDKILFDNYVCLDVLKYFYEEKEKEITKNILYYLNQNKYLDHFGELTEKLINCKEIEKILNKFKFILEKLSDFIPQGEFIKLYIKQIHVDYNYNKDMNFWQMALWSYYITRKKNYYNFTKDSLSYLPKRSKITDKVEANNLYELFYSSISVYENLKNDIEKNDIEKKYEIKCYNLLLDYYNDFLKK